MLKLRTRLRAWLLGTWEPPPGVWARVAVAADGWIRITHRKQPGFIPSR